MSEEGLIEKTFVYEVVDESHKLVPERAVKAELSAVEKEFWLHVKTTPKNKLQFALVLDPALLQLKDHNTMTPLHWAVYRNYTTLAKFLIQKGLSFNQPDTFSRTPKSIAIQRNNTQLLQYIHHLEINQNTK